MKTLKHISLLFLGLFLITSCSNSGNSNSQKQEDLSEEQTIHDIDKLLEDMPPPSLVPFTLKETGVEFDMQHINPLENVSRYQGKKDKMALNMGVFASDISYLAAYGHEEECIQYLETAHNMAETLGDSAIYDKSHLDEFRGHVANANQEEISGLLGKLFLETSVKLEEDHHLTMAGLALTGSFVEGLYQAVITIEKSDNSERSKQMLEPLVKIVLSEEEALRDIIQVLEDLPFDDTIGKIKIELSILDRLYKGDLAEVEEEMANNPDYIVSKDVMRDITLEVKRIRESIVE